MKFLKSKNISKFSISDKTFFTNTYGRIITNSRNSLQLPKGTTSEQPTVLSNGQIRYNTQTHNVEILVNGIWELIRFQGPATITKQTLGPGDGSTRVFGPLSYVPASDNNIIVLIENVIQISTTNYIVVQNPPGHDPGHYLEFTSGVVATKFITVLYGFDM